MVSTVEKLSEDTSIKWMLEAEEDHKRRMNGIKRREEEYKKEKAELKKQLAEQQALIEKLQKELEAKK